MNAAAPTTETGTENVAALLKKLIAKQEETNALLRKERAPWLDADAAAELLGRPVTASGTHKRVLAWLREHGYLTVFGSQRPYTYWRDEVLDVQRKIVGGKLMIPSL